MPANIITVEDPVENRIPEFVQVQIHKKVWGKDIAMILSDWPTQSRSASERVVSGCARFRASMIVRKKSSEAGSMCNATVDSDTNTADAICFD